MIESTIIVFLTAYALFILFVTVTALRHPRQAASFNKAAENVSIVIPCKNEAVNIPALTASLERQNYPGKIEVVFVNDDSVDETAAVIEKVRDSACRIDIRSLAGTYETACHLTSKQQALDLGIHEATYPLIALTDADMIMDMQWLSSLTCSLKPDSDLIFGHTAILPDGSVFTFFQSFQLEFLFAVASVFHYCGIIGSCMGNNLLLRKQAYLDSGGQKAIGYTITEDRALLRHFQRSHRKIHIVAPFVPTAYTIPHRSLHAFLLQMRRWAGGGFGTGINLLFFGLAFTLQNAIFLLGVTGFFTGGTRLIGISNFILTWFFLFVSFKKNRSPVPAFLFPVYYLFLLVETIVLLPLLLFQRKIIWKGRTV